MVGGGLKVKQFPRDLIIAVLEMYHPRTICDTYYSIWQSVIADQIDPYCLAPSDMACPD